MNTDYIIEYAHIFTDEEFGEDQIKSIEALKDFTKWCDSKNKTYSKIVLVDDYNPNWSTLSLGELYEKLKDHDAEPDSVLLESALEKYALHLSLNLDKSAQKNLVNYVQKNQYMTCSLLISCFHLLNLGAIPNIYKKDIVYGRPESGEQKVLILNNKYQGVEEKSKSLISRSSDYKDFNEKIERIYY